MATSTKITTNDSPREIGDPIVIKGVAVANLVITNNTGQSIQYSTNSGSTFTTLTTGSSANLGSGVPSSFRFRRATSGAYPLAIDAVYDEIDSLGAKWNPTVAALVHPVTGYNAKIVIGELFIRPLSYTEITTGGPPKHIIMNDVVVDTLGCCAALDGFIAIPDYVISIDAEYCTEAAVTTSGFGSDAGVTRAMTMNTKTGAAITGFKSVAAVHKVGGPGIAQGFAMNVSMVGFIGDDRLIKPAYIQDSGVTIRVGDSSGTSRAQTYVKMRFYG